MKVTFLGSGPSHTVEGEGRDRRTNTSVLIEDGRFDVIIGMTKQFRENIEKYAEGFSPEDLDAFLLSHGHNDMTSGVAQVRRWLDDNDYDWFSNPVPVYCEKETWNRLKEDFQNTGHLNPVFINPDNRFSLQGISIRPFRVDHSRNPKRYPTVGYRFGNDLTWCEDVTAVPSKNVKYFDNVDTVCLDAAMWFGKSVFNHFNVEDALSFMADKKVNHIYLIQLGRTYPEWRKAQEKVKDYWKNFKNEANVNLAYDGLVLEEGRDIMTQHVNITLKPKNIYSEKEGKAYNELADTNREYDEKTFIENPEGYSPSELDNKVLMDDIRILTAWMSSYMEHSDMLPHGEEAVVRLATNIWMEIAARKESGDLDYVVTPEEGADAYKRLWDKANLSKRERAVLTTPEEDFSVFGENEVDEVYSKWKDSVNMTAGELKKWSVNPCSREASKKPVAVIKRNLRLLDKPKEDWTEKDAADAMRTYNFINRMKPNKPDGNPKEGVKGCPTKWAISLLNWAYNPFDELPEIPDEMEKVDEVEYSENPLDLDTYINNPLLITDLSDEQLKDLHDLAHDRYNAMRGESSEFISIEDVWNLHKLICQEMGRRGMSHNSPMPRLAEKFSESREIINSTNEFDDRTIVHDFASVVGSTMEEPEGEDVDVLVRISESDTFVDYVKRAVWAAFNKEFESRGIDKDIDLIGEAPGPHASYKPVYDLVLVNKGKSTVDYAENLEFPFTPQKPSDKYQYDKKGMLEAMSEKDDNYYVEFKADGFHVIVEKKGDEVSVVTEDGTEVKDISDLKSRVKKLSDKDFVVDGELVYVDDEGLGSRRYLMPFLEGDGAEADDSNVGLYVWDIVKYGEDVLTDMPLEERKKTLDTLGFEGKINQVPGTKVESKTGAEDAVDKFSEKDESEGVVVKEVSSKYRPGYKGEEWYKYRKTQSFFARIVGKNTTEEGDCNYRYGIDLKESQAEDVLNEKILEMDSDKVLDLGNTFNTDVCSGDKNEIIEVQVEEVWRHKEKGGVYYSVHKPVFKGLAEGREETSSLERLDNIVSALGVEVVEDTKFQDIGGEEVGEDEEGGTRSDAADKFWSDNWYKMFSEDGEGKFAFQMHWRGLTKEQAGMSHEELLARGKDSIHGDLRWEVGEKLAGFTVFEGDASEVPDDTGSKLVDISKKKDDSEFDKLRGTFKLAQPREWLKAGEGKGLIQEPGEIGSTTEKYAKFFRLDNGEYSLGVMHKHYVELFLDGDELSGRVQMLKVPVGGNRVWMIDFPENQTPSAQEKTLAEQVEELKESDTDHEWLIWNDPKKDDEPKKVDVKEYKSREEKEYSSVREMVDEEWS